MVWGSGSEASALSAARAAAAAFSSSPARRFRSAIATWLRASSRALLSRVSLKLYSGATRSPPRGWPLGLTKVSREQPPQSCARATASRHHSGSGIAAAGRFDPLAELRLAAGAVHHLDLELAAGRVDVVAAGPAYRRDAPG